MGSHAQNPVTFLSLHFNKRERLVCERTTQQEHWGVSRPKGGPQPTANKTTTLSVLQWPGEELCKQLERAWKKPQASLQRTKPRLAA